MSPPPGEAPALRLARIERRRVRVRGVVQGVGFRPFVFRLAQDLDLAGWVRNDGAGVEIEVQGAPGNISALLARLVGEAPPLARIDSIATDDCALEPDDHGFTIAASGAGEVTTAIGHDSTVCPDCLAELFDPADRRWRYPFINCTHCGPRYTLTAALPYDRATTSMAAFELCPSCGGEYTDPTDRRFHAEPNACPACGPRLSLLEAFGLTVATRDPVADTVLRLLCGEIVAVKGLGGFHLICDARNPEAVERLRERKAREAKPFALMVANLASARHWAALSQEDEALLGSPERPVVLVDKRDSVDHELWGVAPGLAWVGLMLPYTPLHHLLFHDAAGRPAGTGWLDLPQDLVLVCTSANPGGEPLVTGNREAVRRLAGIADAFLIHDREIVTRCDDSVLRAVARGAGDAGVQFIRRSRGYTPRAIRLARKGPAVLAFGAHLKNTVCLTRGNEAFLSHHIGDLDNPAACQAMDEAAEHLQRILALNPDAVAHDLHPDFHGSRAALQFAARLGIPAIPVQHHHGHIAAVAAENRHDGPLLGLAMDGVGMGADGGVWGGELLCLDGPDCLRMGHLATLPLPGADRAAREPWRMAAAVLCQLDRVDDMLARHGHEKGAALLPQLLAKPGLCPPTSSLGRWFDAAAGLLGLSRRMDFEGQAAMLLEGLAARHGNVLPLPEGWRILADPTHPAGQLDLLPLLGRLADEGNPARGAARFHATLIAALEDWAARAARDTGIRTVALGGGCFLNRILSDGLTRRLAARGLTVLEARQAPPSDGGLALGQAHVARQHLMLGRY